jgi:lipid A 3-O-deacylase
MKTRLISLLFSATILGISFPAHSNSQDADYALSRAAIGGALLSWLYAYLANDQAFKHATELDWDKHRIGLSQGYFSANSRYTDLYYGKPTKQDLVSNDILQLKVHWELNLAYWDSDLNQTKNKNGSTLSFAPILSYSLSRAHISPYIETGIGLAYISNSTMENIEKSTQFQFTEILGIGMQLYDWQIGYRFRHISNAGISLPNNATDIHSLHVAYQF